MKRALLLLAMSFGVVTSSNAQISVGIGLGGRGVSLGVNISTYPEMVQIPGYPVYYDPQGSANYFFYDGLYWMYQDDGWYQSGWYNGPWSLVDPDYVPLFLLRVPVRYYRQPPAYFRGWSAEAAPRWGDHWGQDWDARRRGWNQWDHSSAPRPAPLPIYQRQYTGGNYPRSAEQQQSIRSDKYHYQPTERVNQGNSKPQAAGTRTAPVQAQRPAAAPAQRPPSQPDRQNPATDRAAGRQASPQDRPVDHKAPAQRPPTERQQQDHPAVRQEPVQRAPVRQQPSAQERPAPHQEPAQREQREQPEHRAQPQARQPERQPQGKEENKPQEGGQGEHGRDQ
jgi:hypothetical protein